MSAETVSTDLVVSRVQLLRDGLLKAADHIETHPDQFDFGTIEVPHTCGSPGCALGWVHHFSGIKGKPSSFGEELIEASNLSAEFGHDGDFYAKLDELLGDDNWRLKPGRCAEALRLYAGELTK